MRWQRWAIPVSGVPVLALLAWGLTRDARTIPSPLPGKPAPDFALQTLAGDSLRLGDLKGQVVLVNFWASWCLACRAEHGVLVSTAKRSEEHTSELQSPCNLVCRLLLEKKKTILKR